MILTVLVVGFIAGSIFAAWRVSHKSSTAGKMSLPGPKGWPIVGSVPDLDAKNPWMSFQRWAEEYGDIFQCNLGGSNHIWISDENIAHELLSKRAAKYSDRPHIPALLADNRNSGQYLPLMSQNEPWKRQRKFATVIMRESQRQGFFEYPELEAKRLLMELLVEPGRYNAHLESFIARVTCRLAWGTPEASDELKQRARELLIGVSPTGALGNKLPFVMSLPAFLSPAKAWERRRARTEAEFFRIMQEQVRAEHQQKRARPSWTTMFLDMKSRLGFTHDLEGAYAVGMHGIAGALTIAAPMQGFCLAMCHYPWYLPKLQEEIDGVCGERPPRLADMERMPYLRACIRETMRWRPPVPTGIPHEILQDDVYTGYHIAGPSTIHPFEWGMSRNAKKYPQPNAFNPDRWVDASYPTYREPLTQHPSICGYSQFGYGRRTCQGQEVTEADLFCGIGAMAWGFRIGKAIDMQTKLEVPVPEMEYSELLIAKPKWFAFALEPRSERRRHQIVEQYREADSKGCFGPSRRYWDDRNPALGWGKV